MIEETLPPPMATRLAPAAAPRSSRRRTATVIQSIGIALPGSGFLQSELVEFMKRAHRADARLSRVLDVLYRRSGIQRRYSCLEDYGRAPEDFEFLSPDPASQDPPSTGSRMAAYREASVPLAIEAVKSACHRLPDFQVHEITHLIVASCTGFYAPGLDVELVAALGLSPRVARTLIGFQGCQAGLSSLRVADALCRADRRATVLVVCVELCTLHLQLLPTEDNLLANSLFGDGACAVILRAEDGASRSRVRSSGEPLPPRLAISRCASWLQADSGKEMAWTVGDQGFEMRLSAMVPRLLGLHVGRFFEDAMGMAGPDLRAFDFWAVHPGGPAILDEIERSLALDPSLLFPSRAVLREYGNMSSPSVLFVLDRIWSELDASGTQVDRLPARGIALAFGPGLTIEGILFEAIA
jgi:predicted naringenin-chalcone synthase